MSGKVDQSIAHHGVEIKALPYAKNIISEDGLERHFGIKIIRTTVAAGKKSLIFKCQSQKYPDSYCLVKPYKMGKDKVKASLREDTCQIMRYVSGKCAQLISTYDIFYSNEKIYLICDWSSKGEILTAMKNSTVKPNEEMLRNWTIDIVSAIQFLHNNAICHRNIAPSCLLLTADNRCKIGTLSDAGVYCKTDGTVIKFKWPNFSKRNNWNQAPEVATRKPYDGRPADMWCIGATVFWFIVRAYPINYAKGNRPKQLEDRLNSMRKVTNRCQKFVRALLTMDPTARPSPAQALEFEWMTMTPSGGKTPKASEKSVEISNERTETGEAGGSDEPAPDATPEPAPSSKKEDVSRSKKTPDEPQASKKSPDGKASTSKKDPAEEAAE